jgi:hypothetical protein
MKLVDRAWDLQHRVEGKLDVLPVLSCEKYLYIVGNVFVLTGLGLFVVCLLYGFNSALLNPLWNPVFYLVLGLVVFFFRWSKCCV